jgi:MIP family channel proteins
VPLERGPRPEYDAAGQSAGGRWLRAKGISLSSGVSSMNPMKSALAEFLGTFMLVFLGAGSGALLGANDAGLVGVALTHGLALLVIAYAWGPVSGAHVNPAVTFGLALTSKIDWMQAVRYWVAQMAGAAAACYLLAYLIGKESGLGATLGVLTLGANGAAPEPIKAMVAEGVLTFFLMCAVFGSGVSTRNGNAYGLAIGLVLTADIIMGGKLTGGSMNPARSFGPFLVLGKFEHFYIYVIGPCVGAGLAAVLYDAMFIDKNKA